MAEIKNDWVDVSETYDRPVLGISQMAADDYNAHATQTNVNTAAITTLDDAFDALAATVTGIDALTDLDTTVTGAQLNADHAKLAGVAAGSTANATDVQLRDRSTHTGTQTSTTISDFTEAAQDAINALLIGASGVSLSYNDAANTLTITGPGATSALAEDMRDVIGVALIGSGLISVAVNDGADTITITTTATANSAESAAATASTLALRDAAGSVVTATPTTAAQAATKQYVDSLMHTADACTVTGETYTIAGNAVTQITGLVIDGVTLGVGAKIMIRNSPATSGVANAGTATVTQGLYVVTSVAGGNLAVARAPEMSGSVNPVGHMIRILGGTSYGPAVDTIVTCTSPTLASNFVAYGTTALAFGDYLLGWISINTRINTAVGSGRSLRILVATSASTHTINVDNTDYWRSIAQAVNVTSVAISGTPFNGHILTMEWADNGTARTIARGASFVAGTAPMITTTIVGSTVRETFRYNALISKYECIESTVESTPRVKMTEYSNASTSATVSGTVPIPPGAVGVRLCMKIGGQGGGSGRRGAAGTARTGGGGGGTIAGTIDRYLPIPSGVATYAYSLAPVGSGGAAVTANDTNGNPGTGPGTVSFTLGSGAQIRLFNLSFIAPGAGGQQGVASGNAGGTGAINNGLLGAYGGSSPATGAAGGVGGSSYHPDISGGAGAGGGITAADVAGAGGNGGFNSTLTLTTGNGGVVDSTLPTSGTAVDTSGFGLAGAAPGGGAASITTAAQAGANGVGYGSPGGGGGASLNGFNSGKGGDGGPAYMRLEWVYA